MLSVTAVVAEWWWWWARSRLSLPESVPHEGIAAAKGIHDLGWVGDLECWMNAGMLPSGKKVLPPPSGPHVIPAWRLHGGLRAPDPSYGCMPNGGRHTARAAMPICCVNFILTHLASSNIPELYIYIAWVPVWTTDRISIIVVRWVVSSGSSCGYAYAPLL